MLPLGLCALCLAYLLPGHYPPWVSFQQQWVASFGMALIGISAALQGGSKFTRWPILAGVALTTSLVPLVQTMTGQVEFVSDGVLAGLYVAAFALSVVAGASFANSRRSELLDGLCGVLIAASVISTGIALFQWLRLGESLYFADLPPNARAFANLAQPNHLATLLALGVASLLRWYEVRRIAGWVAAIGVAWLGFGMVMTQSRAAWLFVGLTLIAWVALHRKARLRLPATAVIGGALAFFLTVLLWGTVSDAMYVSSQALETRLSPGPRTLIWSILIDAVRHSPWLGYGWNQIGLAQQATAHAHPGANYWFTDSHNLFLDLILWNGLPLGLLMSGLLVLWVCRQILSCRDPEHWALLLAVSAVLLHAMVEFPYDYSYFLLPVGLIMGVLDSSIMESRFMALPRIALALPLVFMVAMLGWIGAEYLKVEESARQLRFVTAGIGLDRVSDVPVPKVWLLDGPREFHRFIHTQPGVGLSIAELDWMRTVAERYSTAPVLFRYAVAAGLNGQPQEALRILDILCRTNLVDRRNESRAEWMRLKVQHAELQAISFPCEASTAASLN
jgi:O-antigen ligase